jgi:hypothetical protein
MDHSATTAACVTCHNNSAVPGKPGNHPSTTNNCAGCHTTSNWTSIRLDHNEVLGGCGSCHNGTLATGKPTGHFITTLECDSCHLTSAWTPSQFSHPPGAIAAGHDATVCTNCHIGNNQATPWKNPEYAPDCAACHASKFKPSAHQKTKTPQTNYTVSELRDCTGSCHIYSNSTLTTITTRRNSHHRATDRGF